MVSILTEVKGKHAVAAVIYHALYAYFFCQLSIAKLATVFGKAENTIRSWIDRYEREGLVGRQQLAAVPSKFSLEERVWVYEFYKRNPTKYLKEAAAAFRKNFKKYISKTTIWSILHRDWNMTWKVRPFRLPFVISSFVAHQRSCRFSSGVPFRSKSLTSYASPTSSTASTGANTTSCSWTKCHSTIAA